MPRTPKTLCHALALCMLLWCSNSPQAHSQRIQFPPTSGLRPIQGTQLPGTGGTTMVPINPATQAGIYPSTGFGSPNFDPYSGGTPNAPTLLGAPTPIFGGQPTLIAPPAGNNGAIFAPGAVTTSPLGNYPAYNGVAPTMPGVGQSGIVGTFQNTPPNFGQPGLYPSNSPAALFPGYGPANGATNGSGSIFGGFFSNLFGPGNNAAMGVPQASVLPPNYGGGNIFGGLPNINPQGTMFNGGYTTPQFIRLFQGPRFRHGFVYGDENADSLMINDSDVSLAFAIPNFLYSTQPLYLMPSFSLHQWDGPQPPSTADLPPLAYSAFLDSGWQSDPARILGAELGLRVGMFSDFDTATSDSLRIMGRGIGRIRLTPTTTLKLGVLYLDRNKVKLLPAGGLLWQPNQDTRFDLFFPEPKLSHYLTTLGNTDSWWYVGGYYGGGAWTVQRTDTTKDSIDINDLRLVLGLEWGRNEQMREGRRVGFLEVGYVFDRELLYNASPLDNLSLQDTVMIRAGIGY